MTDDVNFNDMTLADLAEIDFSDVEAVRYEIVPEGVYVFEIAESGMHEGHNRENDRRFHAEVRAKIIEVKSVLTPGVDKDSLLGKAITEKLYMTPSDEDEKKIAAIGRMKAFVEDIGAEWTGRPLTDFPALVGHTFTGKVVHQSNPDDKSIKYPRLRLEKKR